MLNESTVSKFLTTLGIEEEPIGWYFTDIEPEKGIQPEEFRPPNPSTGDPGTWSCIYHHLLDIRKQKVTAYFDAKHFGCPGAAYHIGFMRPVTDRMVYYVSTGEPGGREPELYLDSPEAARKYFSFLEPFAAPNKYLVLQPLSSFVENKEANPEFLIFFQNPDAIAGLHQLVTFVTEDMNAVKSPWGSGCANLITWPQYFKEKNETPAVLGSWDPSCRVSLKPNEIALTVSFEIFKDMLEKWDRSFLTTHTWQQIKERNQL